MKEKFFEKLLNCISNKNIQNKLKLHYFILEVKYGYLTDDIDIILVYIKEFGDKNNNLPPHKLYFRINNNCITYFNINITKPN